MKHIDKVFNELSARDMNAIQIMNIMERIHGECINVSTCSYKVLSDSCTYIYSCTSKKGPVV